MPVSSFGDWEVFTALVNSSTVRLIYSTAKNIGLWLHSSGLWQGLGALSLLLFIHQELQRTVSDNILMCTFLGAVFAYAWNKFTDRDEDQINNPHRTLFTKPLGKYFTIFIGLLFCLNGLYLLFSDPRKIPYFLLPLLLGSLYMMGPFKKWFLVKNLSIALAWSALLFCGFDVFEKVPLQLLDFFGIIFLGAFSNTLLFDLTDILGDQKKGIHTLVAFLNQKNTYFLLATLLMTMMIWIFKLPSNRSKTPLFIYTIWLGLCCFYPNKKSPWYRGFLLDGEFLILLICSGFAL